MESARDTACSLTYTGRIEVITGPMFSGKTSSTLRRVKMHRHAKKTCLLVKHEMDARYQKAKLKTEVITHDGYSMDAVACSDLVTIISLCVGPVAEYDVVAIDEGQFFPCLVKWCDYLANKGKIVIVSCLSGSFARKPMGDVSALLSIADKVTMLRGVCSVCCTTRACFTKEKIAGSVGSSGVKVGGPETYIPVCRKCYHSTKHE